MGTQRRFIKGDGSFTDRAGIVAYLQECATRWEEIATSYPHSSARPDRGAQRQAFAVREKAKRIAAGEDASEIDPREINPAEKILIAGAAMDGHREAGGFFQEAALEVTLADLITNLLHLAEAKGFNLRTRRTILEMALENHAAELATWAERLAAAKAYAAGGKPELPAEHDEPAAEESGLLPADVHA